MRVPFQIALVLAQILLCLGTSQQATAQLSNTQTGESRIVVTTEQVVNKMVQRNMERAQALGAYQETRVYRLEYRGFPSAKSAEMTVDMEYRFPATKVFSIRSEKGSHLLIEKVFQKLMQSEQEALTEENRSRLALNTENYRFTLEGYGTTHAGPCYILSVEPRTKNKLLYRGRIWVDAVDFAVARIEARPAKNPSFWTKETKIEQTYAKVGEFWLPVSNRTSSIIRLGGHALLTIDYQRYKVKAGSDLRTTGTVAENP